MNGIGTKAESRTDSGVWLHGVLADSSSGALSATRGISGTPVRSVTAAGLVAVVSDVPLAEYGEQALRRNLENPVWLERTVRSHHAVVHQLSRTGAVVPARLAIIYNSDERVAHGLADRHDELAAALEWITGREEWGVKAYAVPDRDVVRAPDADSASPSDASPDDAGPGAAYLRRRKAELAARQQGQQAAAAAAEEVHAALAVHAVAARRHPLQDRRLSGAATAMVLNGAYLIEREGVRRFAAEFHRLASRSWPIRLELTGPWPPYSFVDTRENPAPQREESA